MYSHAPVSDVPLLYLLNVLKLCRQHRVAGRLPLDLIAPYLSSQLVPSRTSARPRGECVGIFNRGSLGRKTIGKEEGFAHVPGFLFLQRSAC